MSPDPARDAIRNEAEQWLARRHDRVGDTSQQDESAFHAWLQADPRHAQAYRASEKLWQEYRQLGDAAGLAALRRRTLRQSRRQFRSPWPRALAAAAVLAVTAGSYIAWTSTRVEVARYATTIGEQRTVSLSDQSEVTLNTNTTLEIRFSRARREVVLSQGEARFQVAGNRSRPFVVLAQGTRVTALGTQFQVRRDSDRTLVTLAEGSVQVVSQAADTARVLMPDQQAIVHDGRREVVVHAVDAGQMSSWTTGRLDFQALPLQDVVREANRYAARKLSVGDPSIAELKISGNFLAGDNAAIAKGLEVVFPVRAEHRADGTIALYAAH